MAENLPPITTTTPANANADSTRGMPYYEKLRRDLRETLQKKRLLDKNMAALEDTIYRYEGTYLEETGAGNIIKGFDNYIKGSTGVGGGAGGAGSFGASSGGGGGAGGSRRKGVVGEMDRVFSRSSVAGRQDSPPPLSSTQTTPGHTHAPTPTSSFAPPLSARESNHPTPTSSTSTKAGGGGWKKNKKDREKDKERERDEEGDAADRERENGKVAKRLKISYGRD